MDLLNSLWAKGQVLFIVVLVIFKVDEVSRELECFGCNLLGFMVNCFAICESKYCKPSRDLRSFDDRLVGAPICLIEGL
jgi:hypothetical protein